MAVAAAAAAAVAMKAIGGGINYGWGALSASKAFKKQKKILKNQIQWRVADMRAAGLNPILAVNPGGGGNVNAPMGPSPPGGDIATSAKTVARLPAEMKVLRSQVEIANNESERTKHAAEREVYEAARSYVGYNREAFDFEIEKLRLPAAKAQGELDASELGKRLRQLNRIIRSGTGRDQTR